MTDKDLVPCDRLEGQPASWFSKIDLSLPYWQDYRQLILRLQKAADQGPEGPIAYQLQQLLPGHALNHLGQPVTFLPSRAIPGVKYEEHIFRTGEVSTRENNWHDLFNALIWARFPCLKSAMNAMHYQQIRQQAGTLRGRLRDALTLLDECGVILASANDEALSCLAARDWQWVFRNEVTCWQEDIRVFVCGHALLEKFLKPYKSLTSKALLIRLDVSTAARPRENLQQVLDHRLAEKLLTGALLNSPADLSPLPLMGIPGWWSRSEQDDAFYSDRLVFRQPSDDFSPAPIFDLAAADAGFIRH